MSVICLNMSSRLFEGRLLSHLEMAVVIIMNGVPSCAVHDLSSNTHIYSPCQEVCLSCEPESSSPDQKIQPFLKLVQSSLQLQTLLS